MCGGVLFSPLSSPPDTVGFHETVGVITCLALTQIWYQDVIKPRSQAAPVLLLSQVQSRPRCSSCWDATRFDSERPDRVQLEFGGTPSAVHCVSRPPGTISLQVNYTQRWCCGRWRGGGCELRFTSGSDIELNYNCDNSKQKWVISYRVKKIKTSDATNTTCFGHLLMSDVPDFLKRALFRGCIMWCSVWTQGTDCMDGLEL